MNQYNFANNLGFGSEIKSEKAEIFPLNINNLTLIKNFPAKNINPQFSLDIGRGEVFCLICPDINEKNALSDTLSGILPPENGSIEINGYDLYSDRAPALSYMGVARPDMKFYPELTAYENLLLVAKLKKCKSLICRDTSDSASTVSPEAAAEQAARLAGFEKILRGGSLFCVRTGKFGKAEHAKLIIASAIVGRPELLIIDSPRLLTESSEDAEKLSLLIKYMSSLGTAVLVIDSGSDRLAELLSRDTKIGIVSCGSLAALGTADEISAGSITDSTEYEIILACKPDDDTMKSAEAVLLSLGHRSFSMDDSGRLLINIPNRDREKTVAWLIRMLVERNIDICSVTPLYKSGLDIVIGELVSGVNGNDAEILAKTIPGIRSMKGDNRNDE